MNSFMSATGDSMRSAGADEVHHCPSLGPDSRLTGAKLSSQQALVSHLLFLVTILSSPLAAVLFQDTGPFSCSCFGVM